MDFSLLKPKIKLSYSYQELKDEYMGLIYNEKCLEKEEHPNLTDAALYTWRFCTWSSPENREKLSMEKAERAVDEAFERKLP